MSNPAQDERTLAEQAEPSYECVSCGYVYEPSRGDSNSKIPAGTPFQELPMTWRCPVCGARTTQFRNIGAVNAPSGFAQNLNYGFGVNRLTSGQKSLLIFGGLSLLALFFLGLYGLH